MRISIFILCIVFSISAGAQDRMLLMNGQWLDCRILGDSGTVMVFELTKKNGKIKKRELHKNDVFSYQLAGQEEIILYAQDEMMGDIYTVDQMLVYLAGERDARNNFHARPTALVGFILCGAIAFAGQDGFLTATVPPIVYMLVQLVPKIKIRESYMSSPDYKYNDIYADGFEPPARSKKIIAALTSGLSGSAAGLLLYFITK